MSRAYTKMAYIRRIRLDGTPVTVGSIGTYVCPVNNRNGRWGVLDRAKRWIEESPESAHYLTDRVQVEFWESRDAYLKYRKPDEEYTLYLKGEFSVSRL